MPIITPEGELKNPKIVYCGHSNWGEMGDVLMFRVYEDDNDEFGEVFLVGYQMGSPGFTWFIGTIETGIKCLHNQHNVHKAIYNECDPYDWYEKDEENGIPITFEEISYPMKGAEVIVQCIAEGVIRFGTDSVMERIKIPQWVDYVEQGKDYMNK